MKRFLAFLSCACLLLSGMELADGDGYTGEILFRQIPWGASVADANQILEQTPARLSDDTMGYPKASVSTVWRSCNNNSWLVLNTMEVGMDFGVALTYLTTDGLDWLAEAVAPAKPPAADETPDISNDLSGL